MQSNSSATQWQVADLIPHRGSMQLLTQILAADEQALWAKASSESNRSSCWGIEYLSQATAAFFTLTQLNQLTDLQAAELKPARGMLIGSRRYQAHQSQLQAGCELLLQVSLQAPSINSLGASGLVKFGGHLWGLPAGALASLPLSTSAPRLPYDTASLAVLEGELLVEADLSVYIPPQ